MSSTFYYDKCNPDRLSAKIEGSFAYKTVKDRLPEIITKAVDHLSRMKNEVIAKHGEEGRQELVAVVGRVSRLRSELMTDKPLRLINGSRRPDLSRWNNSLQERASLEEAKPSYFKTYWLYVECYIYRYIVHSIDLSPIISYIDPFQEQKRDSFITSEGPTTTLLTHLAGLCEKKESFSANEKRKLLVEFFKLALWGNKCDLSISGGAQNAQQADPLEQLVSLDPYLLVDETPVAYKFIEGLPESLEETTEEIRIDIILDNAGFELVTDLALAHFLTEMGYSQKIRFHCKAMPWFVSDVTCGDLDWTLEKLCNSESELVSQLGEKWKANFEASTWTVDDHLFWTLPYDYSEMILRCADLYADLRDSCLMIFKGDLNYRKLLGDIPWPPAHNFPDALRGFRPVPLVALRTLKSDLVAGLPEGKAEELNNKDKNWMTSGTYGVIQYAGFGL